MATQNLGNVRALIVSATAPTNTNLLWRNTSVSPETINLYNSVTSIWEPIAMSSGGEDNTASNLGTGEGIFAQKVGVDLRFKSLIAGTNITLSSDSTSVTINTSAEVNVQADWNETDTANDAYIENKPTIPAPTPANRLLPAGGTNDQVLTKASGTDYDVEWTTPDTGISDVALDGTYYVRINRTWQPITNAVQSISTSTVSTANPTVQWNNFFNTDLYIVVDSAASGTLTVNINLDYLRANFVTIPRSLTIVGNSAGVDLNLTASTSTSASTAAVVMEDATLPLTNLGVDSTYKVVAVGSVATNSTATFTAFVAANPVGGTTFNPADHSVTEFNDVTNAGSGQIITAAERTAITNGVTRRRISNAPVVSNTMTLDWNGLNELYTNSLTFITGSNSVVYSNTTNAELAIFEVGTSSNSSTLVFPSGTRMQDSESRWNAGTRTLTLPANGNLFKLTLKRDSDTLYTLECSDNYSS